MSLSPKTLAAAMLGFTLATVTGVSAGSFPDQPIKLIVGFGSGGPTDTVARLLADQLSKDLGQNVIVENRTGASGNIATEAVANADADGYTYLIGANPLASNESLFPDFPVKFGRDIIAVAAIGAAENVLVVRSSLNVHNLSEFAQRARAKPNAISYATLGTGSSSHVAGIAFSLRAGCTILAVGYRSGADALKDLLADRVDAWFAPIPSVLGAVQTGQLVALSTTGPERAASLPDVPTISESGFPGYDVRLWTGVFARSGVPAERLRTMEQAIGRVLISPDFRMALQRQGIAPLSMSRDQFTAFVIQEVRSAKTIIAAFSKEEH